jgi:hypothetical protein
VVLTAVIGIFFIVKILVAAPIKITVPYPFRRTAMCPKLITIPVIEIVIISPPRVFNKNGLVTGFLIGGCFY